MKNDSFHCPAQGHIPFQESAEPHFASIVENMGGGFIIYDAQWRFVFINAEAERLLGIQRDEVLGRIVWEVFPSLSGTRLEQEYRRAAAGELRDFEDFHEPWGRFFHNRCFPRTGDGMFHSFHDITDQKRTEETIRAQEERENNFRSLIETTSDLIVVATVEGRILFTNKNFADRLGFSGEELGAMHILDLHPPSLRREAEEIFSTILRGEQEICPLPLLTREGVLLPVETRAWCGRWNSSECIFGFIKDLSDDQEAQQRFERLFRHSPAPATLSSLSDRKILDVNNAFLAKFGYARSELIGKTSLEIGLYREQSETVEAMMQQGLSQGTFSGIELQITGKDGVQVDGLFSGEVISSQGRDYFLTVMIDITERKQLEEQLRSSEERYRSLVETTSDCIWEIDSQGRFTYISPNFQDMTGYPPAEFIGRDRLELMPEEIKPEPRKQWADILAAQQPIAFVEETLRHRDGRLVIIEVSAVSRFNTEGTFQGMRGIARDITERKRSEKEREQYFKLFNTSSDLMVIAEPDGRFRKINPAGLKILGYSESEMLSRPYVAFIHPDDRNRTIDEVPQLLLAGNIVQFENRYLCKDGACRWLAWRAIFDKDEGLAYAAAQDITDRKRAEEELVQAHRKAACANATLNAVIETMSDWVWEINGEGRYTYCSPKVEYCLGYAPAEIIGKTPFDLMPPEEAERISVQFAEIRQQKAGFRNLENKNISKDGRHVLLSTSGVPILDAADNLLGYRGIERDITELRQTEDDLRKAEAYARNLIEVNLDPLVTIAPDGSISDVNKASMLATGCSREEMIGTDFCSYFTDPEDARAGYKHVFDQGMIRDYPLEIRHRDGHVTPVLYNAIVLLNESGQVAGVFAAARDITQLKQAEEELKALNTDLERRVEQRTLELQETQKQFLHVEKLSAIGKLSASIAHEFNNPLQGIFSILKGIKKRAILEEEDRELLDAAIDEGDRVKNLIRSLQDFHRPTSGLERMMDVHASLDAILLLHKSDFREKQITLERHYAESLPHIVAVADQIKQVFLNLLTNAADACQYPGGVITVSTRLEGEYVAVEIKDTGIGIKAHEIEQIFQPFFTTKPAVKGTGLGLSVSYGIVKNHQGNISVKSCPVEGTIFTVSLPIKKAGPAPGSV